MPFAIAAAGITAAGAIGGGILQSNAAKDAASKANAAQQEARDQARKDLMPWSASGGQANTATGDLLGLNGPDAASAARDRFQASPGYQWSLDQGLRATDAGAAAQGFGRSGAVLKAEQTFGTGLANQEFTNYYNRLFDISKLGENAAAGQGTASLKTGEGIAQTDLSLGSALSSIYGNTVKGVSGAANSYVDFLGYQNALSGGGGGSGTLSSYAHPAGGAPYYSSSNPGQNWTV